MTLEKLLKLHDSKGVYREMEKICMMASRNETSPDYVMQD